VGVRLDRKWVLRSGIKLTISYVLTIGVTRAVMFALPSPTARWAGLCVFWGLMIVGVALDSPSLVRSILIQPAKRALLAVAAGLGFAVLASVRLGLGGLHEAGLIAVPGALCALFEAVYFFFWWRGQFEKALPPLPALVWTAVAYAIYHIGYYGFSQHGLDALKLTIGTYVVAGCVMGSLASYFGSLWALWPFFMDVAALADFSRLGVAGGHPSAVGIVASLVLTVLAGMAVWSLTAAHSPKNEDRPERVASTEGRSSEGGVASLMARRRVPFTAAAAWMAGATALGLVQRLIINDPIVVDSTVMTDLSGFILQRDYVQEALLRVGFVVYLVVPLLCIYLWHDSRERTCARCGISPLADAAVAAIGSMGAVILASLVGFARLLVGGSPVSWAHLGMIGVMCVSSGLYGWLNASLVMVLSYGIPSKSVRWFAVFLGYIFIFNWWMVYPLFSQYAAVGPFPSDRAAAGEWFRLVWSRATPLYATVPHYHYYMSLVVSYARHLLDRQLVGMHLAMLAGYAAAAWLLVVRLCRRSVMVSRGGN